MKKIFVDYERCVACKGCEIACATRNHPSQSLLGLLGEARTQVNVRVLAIDHEAFPVSCRHCDPAACLDACPAGAIRRDAATGAVLIDPERCKACGMCAMVCPFEAISFKKTHRAAYGREVAYKCDLCADRLQEGEHPACVAACHSRALRFEEFEATRGERAVKSLKIYLMGKGGEPQNFKQYRELRRQLFARFGGEEA